MFINIKKTNLSSLNFRELFICFVLLEADSHHVAQAKFKLRIFLFQALEFRGYKLVLLCPTKDTYLICMLFVLAFFNNVRFKYEQTLKLETSIFFLLVVRQNSSDMGFEEKYATGVSITSLCLESAFLSKLNYSSSVNFSSSTLGPISFISLS